MKPISTAPKHRLTATLAMGLASGALLASGLAYARPTAYVTFLANSRTLTPSVEIANLNGSDARKLGPGMSAAISPSGASVAAVQQLPPQNNATSELVLYPSAAGSPAKKLYHWDGFLTVVGWSADSKWLLVSGTAGTESSSLIVINPASGSTKTIARGVIQGASFAPNNSDDIVYALAKSQLLSAPSNLFVSSANGTGERQLTHDGHDFSPVWGPKTIIFARQTSRGSDYAPINQLWSITPSGAGATQLTHMSVGPLATGLAPVAISASGAHLIADFGGTDQSATWTFDLSSKGAVPHQLGGLVDENVPAAISRSGGVILLTNGFEGEPTSVVTVPWGGGHPTVVATHGASASWNY